MPEINKDLLLDRILHSKELTALEKRYLEGLVKSPPRKQGRWMNTSQPNQLRCSCCDIIHFIAQYPTGQINCCPNCSAEMNRGDNHVGQNANDR